LGFIGFTHIGSIMSPLNLLNRWLERNRIMFEVDDAGGGCFIGPEVLVIHHVESGGYWYYYIPPHIHERVGYATKLLKEAFLELAISKADPVRLCRGEIFDPFENYLLEQGYQVVREKVSEKTDKLAETGFNEVLYSYGLPRNVTLEGRNYYEFYTLVSCWYYSQPQHLVGKIRKKRLKEAAPFWTKKLARKYPNLVRLLIEKEVG
jgi:hypothetical protein